MDEVSIFNIAVTFYMFLKCMFLQNSQSANKSKGLGKVVMSKSLYIIYTIELYYKSINHY